MSPAESMDVAGPFPVERLALASGWLAASAHRNRYKPLHLKWSFGVGFLPLEIGDQSYDTGLNIEIEARDIRRIEQFVGLTRHDTNPDFNIGSFYLFDHRAARETHFCVHAAGGTKLDIEVQLIVDAGVSYGDPLPPLRRVHVRTEVVFEGILVSSYGVQCEPDQQKLIRIAEELFEISAFTPPRRLPDPYHQGTLNLFFDPLR